MTLVTLSRQLGAGGSEVAAGVANALSLRVVDRETVDSAAREAGVPEAALHELGFEGRRGLVERILDALRASPAIPSVVEMQRRDSIATLRLPRAMFTPARPLLSAAMEEYVRMVGMVIRDIARRGGVLIIGQGSQVILKDRAEALHVQIVAPVARRVETRMRIEGVAQSAAMQLIRASDRARADYLRRYYGVNWLDPQLHDLVVNTGRTSVQTAVGLIVLAQRQRVIPDGLADVR